MRHSSRQNDDKFVLDHFTWQMLPSANTCSYKGWKYFWNWNTESLCWHFVERIKLYRNKNGRFKRIVFHFILVVQRNLANKMLNDFGDFYTLIVLFRTIGTPHYSQQPLNQHNLHSNLLLESRWCYLAMTRLKNEVGKIFHVGLAQIFLIALVMMINLKYEHSLVKPNHKHFVL